MSDYDLGRAHGRIEIDSDVDSDAVERGLRKVRDRVDELTKRLRHAEDELSRFEVALDKLRLASRAAAAGMAQFIKTLSSISSQAIKTAADVSGATQAFQDLREASTSAAMGLLAVQRAIANIRNPLALAQSAVFRFGGALDELQRFPKVARDIVKLSASLGALSSSIGTVGKVGSRLVPTLHRIVPGFTAASISAVLFSDKVRAAVMTIGQAYPAVDKVGESIRRFNSQIKPFSKGFREMVDNMSGAILGVALMTSGIRGLANNLKQLGKFSKYGLAAVLAISAIAPLATLILGVVDAVKQLSGALLILPGALASLGVLGGTAIIAITGLAKAFQAGAGDAEAFDDAVKGLSPRMVGLARDVQALKDPFRELRNEITDTAFSSFIEDFRPLAERYMPLLRAGTREVAEGINNLLSQITRFGTETQSIEDFADLFERTGRITDNFAAGIAPMLSALRDIGVVGTQAFEELTSGFSGVMAVFEVWAARVRADGSLENWIDDGIQGFRDLWSVIRDASVITGEFFRALGGDGSNALSRLAGSMASFRESMDFSGGNSGAIFAHLQNVSTNTFEMLREILGQLVDTLVAAIPAVEQFSEAFGSTLVTGLKLTLQILEEVFAVIGELGIISTMTGHILAAGIAFKVLKTSIGPVVNLLKVFGGAFAAKKAVDGFQSMYDVLGKIGTAIPAISGVTEKLQLKMIALSYAAGAVGAALGVAVLGFLAWRTNSAEVDAFNKSNAESAKEAAEGFREIGDAFAESEGKMSPAVFEAVGNSIDTMFSKLDREASTRPGVMAKIGANFKDVFDDPFGTKEDSDTGQIDKMNALNDAAKRAKESFDQLGWSQDDLTRAVTGSAAEYQVLEDSLRNTAYGGGEAINQIAAQRQAFLDLQTAASATENASPGIHKLRDSVKVLADETASATDKMDALTSALEAAGLLQVSEAEAFSQVRESIKGITDEIAAGLGPLEQYQGAFVDGQIDHASEGYGRLWEILKPMSESLRAVGSAGGDVNRAWAEMQPQLQVLQDELDLTDDQMQQLYRSTGLVPDEIRMLVGLEGATEAEQELFTLNQYLDQLKPGVETQVRITSKEAIDELRGLGVWVEQIAGDYYTVKFNTEVDKERFAGRIAEIERTTGAKIKAEVDPESKAKMDEELSKPVEKRVIPKWEDLSQEQKQKQVDYANKITGGTPWTAEDDRAAATVPAPEGVSTPDSSAPPPPEKREINVEVTGTDAALGAIAAVRNALGMIPPYIKKNFELTGTDAAIGAINAVRNAVNAMQQHSRKSFELAGTDAAIGAVNAVRAALDAFPQHTRKTFELAGTDAAIGATNAVVIAVENMANKIVAAVQRARSAMNQFVGAINTVRNAMVNAANSAYNSGATLAQNFANGMNSRIGAVQQAAMNLANAASRPLPSSPAEIGPFSGHGWTPYRGRALAEGFAEGIHQGAPKAQSASMDMAIQIAGAMDQLARRFGKPTFLGQEIGFQETYFGSNRAVGPGGKRYYRDPSITDKELEERKLEQAENAAEKAELDAEKAATKIPDAEEDIREAQERVIDARERARKDREEANKTQEDAEAERNAEKRAIESERSLDKAIRDQAEAEQNLRQLQDQAAQQSSFSQQLPPEALSGGRGGALRPNMSSKDYQNAMNVIAARFGLQNTSGYRNEPGSWHSTGQAADFSNGVQTDQMLAFANFINDNFKPWTEELIYDDPRFSGKQIDSGQNVDDSFFAGAGDHTNHVHWAVKFPPEFVPEMQRGVQQGTEQGVAKAAPKGEDTIPLVRRPDGTYTSSDPEWAKLIDRESGGNARIIQGVQDANSGGNEASGLFQIAKGTWAGYGGTQFAGTAGEATPEQQAIVAARIFNKEGGSPWGSGAGQNFGRENEGALRAGIARGGAATTGGTYPGDTNQLYATDENTKDTVTLLRETNKKLDNALAVAEDENSSTPEVIRALQDIDDAMVGMSATERQSIESVRSGILANRGIAEYDPYEGAPETDREKLELGIGLAQDILGLFNTIETGLSNAVAMAGLLVRGFSNTNDVNTFVDGVQSLVGSVTEVVSTIASIADTVATVAALAGSAIPGVGQVAAVVSGITGGIADINAIVDLVQEGLQIGGRFAGGFLSSILGLGGTGQLQGQVRTLLDLNDQTIKTWSDRNAADKSVIGLPGSEPTNPNAAPGFRDLNIYQGPGSDPAEMMNNAMFAVAAHSQGVYGG